MKSNYRSIQSTLIRAVCCASLLAASSSLTMAELSGHSLYDGIEFEMPVVQEPQIPSHEVDITDFGAVGDGTVLCTDAIHAAIDGVVKKGGGKVIIPAGIWLTGPITLQSKVEIHTKTGALVVFSEDKSLYPIVETDFEGYPTYRCQSPISGRNLTDVAFTGNGIFDGSGGAWRPVKRSKLTENQWKKLVASGGVVRADGNTWFPSEQAMHGATVAEMNVPRNFSSMEEYEAIKDFLRPVMVSLIECERVLLDGPTFQNSPAWCIHPLKCKELTVRNLTVRNPWYSQNGDGIDIDSCKNVVVHDSQFDVGDDAICIKSGKNKEGRDRKMPTENLVIKNCTVFHGHGGVTVGSEMSSGVKNMHVSNCTFIGTDVGLRFKSTRGRGGVVEKIYISDVRMIDIPTIALSFNLYYGGKSVSEAMSSGEMGKESELLPVTEETPQFRDIQIRNVVCDGANTGILLQGLPEMNMEGVLLENVRMRADRGMVCNDVKDVSIRNLTLETETETVMELKNSRDVEITDFQWKTLNEDRPQIRVSGSVSNNIRFENSENKTLEKLLEVGGEVVSGAVSL